MRHQRVGRETVTEAVAALQQRGVRPTLRAVREQLGRGSFSTIQPLLAEVLALQPQAEPAKTPPVRPAGPGPDEAAIERLVGAVQESLGRLRQQAPPVDAAIDAATAPALLRKLEELTDYFQGTLKHWMREVDHHRQRADRLTEQVRLLSGPQGASLQLELARAQRQVQDLTEELRRLKGEGIQAVTRPPVMPLAVSTDEADGRE